jgi:transcriptional regulator with XRE-family HTH domain
MALDYLELQERFLAFLRQRVQNGQITERSLARLTGVSQPHIHNVLKGKRYFSMEVSDRILCRLRVDLLDLIRPEDLAEWRKRR